MPDTSTIELIEVPVAEVPEWWSSVRSHVEKMCKTGGNKYSIASVLNGLLGQTMQLWIAVKDGKIKAAAISEIMQYPLMKCCCLTIAGEDMHTWKGFMENIEKWAISKGCGGMRLIAREGWKKILKSYKCTNIVLEKELTA